MLANAFEETAASICTTEVKWDILEYGQYRNSQRKMQQVPSQQWYLSARPHGLITQKSTL